MKRVILVGTIVLAALLAGPSVTVASAQVTPMVQCYTQDPTPGIVTVYFGYVNDGAPVDIVVGPDNFVSPGVTFQGQPTHFSTGDFPRVFSDTFDPTVESSLIWIVDGIETVASVTSTPVCSAASTSTILNGSGAPSDSIGNDGDFYIDTSADVLYGPKANGAWPTSGVSLIGSPGPAGQNGSNGTNGTNGTNGNSILNGSGPPSNSIGNDRDFYIDTSADLLYGPKANGAWPTPGVSLIGSQGPAGPQGPPGRPVCRNTVAARLLCNTLFVPGTWVPGSSSVHAAFVLSRRDEVYARGATRRVRIGRRCQFSMRKTRRVRPGNYTLTARLASRAFRLTLRRTVTIH